jgi:hypothetical protein
VVEHSLGKGEVLSSILSGSTSFLGSKGRAERGAKLSVALEMPFATHCVAAGFAALGIKQNPMPPARGFGAAPRIVLGKAPFQFCGPADIGSAIVVAPASQHIDETARVAPGRRFIVPGRDPRF